MAHLQANDRRRVTVASLAEGAVSVEQKEARVISANVVDQRTEVVTGIRPVITIEKIVEIPHLIIKEVEKEVFKPQIVERLIERPKTRIEERTILGPPRVEYKEEIVEVPQVVYEERVVHVPKREVHERLIEIPKVEYVERIEYEDVVEYREVIVDRIVEIPEIEYRVREVEHFVPQLFVQEYYDDKYMEVPFAQVQEVQRIDYAPAEWAQEDAAQVIPSLGSEESPHEWQTSTVAQMATPLMAKNRFAKPESACLTGHSDILRSDMLRSLSPFCSESAAKSYSESYQW